MDSMFSDKARDGGSSFMHRLNGSNYKLWKFQIDAIMRSRGITDVLEGNAPEETATAEAKKQYAKDDGQAISILVASLERDQANHILACKTAKQIMDKLSSIHEKKSEVRIMNLYEEWLRMFQR